MNPNVRGWNFTTVLPYAFMVCLGTYLSSWSRILVGKLIFVQLGQEIARHVWNAEVYYGIYKEFSCCPLLSSVSTFSTVQSQTRTPALGTQYRAELTQYYEKSCDDQFQ